MNPTTYPELSEADDPKGGKLDALRNAGFRYELSDKVFVLESPRKYALAVAVCGKTLSELLTFISAPGSSVGPICFEPTTILPSPTMRKELIRRLGWSDLLPPAAHRILSRPGAK